MDILTELSAEDFDVFLTGFDALEMDLLFKNSLKENVKEDNFDITDELSKPPITKQGDIWFLGNHKLVCGYLTKEDTFKILMGDKVSNLVITDPPYKVSYEAKAGKIKNDNLKNDEFYKFLYNSFFNIEKYMDKEASIYVFHADTEGLNFRKAFSEAGFYLSGTCIWKKQTHVLGRSP